jgi:hypothetical protein
MMTKRYFVASIVLCLFLFVIEGLFHGVILKSIYEPMKSMMRPEEGAKAMFFVWMLVAYLIMGFGLTCIFAKGYENRGIGEGIRFGLLVGVTFGISSAIIHHQVFTYPVNYTVSLIIGYPIEMILAGILLALIYKPIKTSTP